MINGGSLGEGVVKSLACDLFIEYGRKISVCTLTQPAANNLLSPASSPNQIYYHFHILKKKIFFLLNNLTMKCVCLGSLCHLYIQVKGQTVSLKLHNFDSER